MGIDKGGLKRRRREASSPPRVTVTVGSSTRINMNSMEEVEEEEDKVGLDGTHSLPNLSLLRAEARARRPHMGTSRYLTFEKLHPIIAYNFKIKTTYLELS